MTKKYNARNWLAVHAHFKTSAGEMGDLKKETSKNECRDFDIDSEYMISYFLSGYEILDNNIGKDIFRKIKIYPTNEQLTKIAQSDDSFSLTSKDIKEVFDIDVENDLYWFLEITEE